MVFTKTQEHNAYTARGFLKTCLTKDIRNDVSEDNRVLWKDWCHYGLIFN